VREPSDVHMPLRVRRLDDVAPGSLFSVGHYHESTAGTAHTLVADPEVVFLRADSGDWVSLSFRAPFAHVATVDVGDSIRLLRAAEHATLVKLVEVWMRNVEVNLLHGGGLEEEINHPASYAAE
jgi:hypothetical protein